MGIQPGYCNWMLDRRMTYWTTTLTKNVRLLDHLFPKKKREEKKQVRRYTRPKRPFLTPYNLLRNLSNATSPLLLGFCKNILKKRILLPPCVTANTIMISRQNPIQLFGHNVKSQDKEKLSLQSVKTNQICTHLH